ncbi:MAG: thiamine pyrophosphate-dependent dehydrogenase E1 component subunit alpha [Spirochaetaceae bacterium]|nr:MAG: thiamine pyrophosphate-dependent dehydrogenase E1 component subunit alpha [Spirochaetaceae bacterium]
MVSKELLMTMYRQIFLIRTFETRCIKLYRSGAIKGYFHPYLGEEAIAVGVCATLRKEDYIVSTHRGHGHCIAKGAAVDCMVAELLGKETGYCRGRGGSMHIADVATGNLGANGIVGGGIAMGVGAALGADIRGENRVTAVFFSDGATANGVFCESLNLAAIWNLPVIFVIENNEYAASTPLELSTRDCDLYKRAAAYCVTATQIDGNDVLVVYEEARKAVKQCRSGKGPVVIECKTYRHQGHHVNDPGAYMPAEKLEYFKNQHDPVDIARRYLLEKTDEATVKAVEEAVQKEMEEAVAFAEASPEPNAQDFLEEVVCKYG